MKVFLISCWILTATVVCSAQTTFYYPHIANGNLGTAKWKTSIFLTNPAAAGTASGTITFSKDNTADTAAAGSVFSTIAFVDQDGAPAGSGGTITFSIPGGQTRKYTSTGDGTYAGGFATVTTTAGSVSGTALFSEFDAAGRLIGEAGVPSASAVTKQAIFVDTIGGFNIGVAYSNPGPSAAAITLTLLNGSGAVVGTPVTQNLGPGNHTARFTSEIFAGSPQFAGSMQIQSSVPVSAIALRFDPAFALFTTLPPFTIASLTNPILHWFENGPLFVPLTSIARLLGVFNPYAT